MAIQSDVYPTPLLSAHGRLSVWQSVEPPPIRAAAELPSMGGGGGWVDGRKEGRREEGRREKEQRGGDGE